MSNSAGPPPNSGITFRAIAIGLSVFLFAAIGGFAIYNTVKSPAEKEPVVLACEPYGDPTAGPVPRMALPIGSKAPDFSLKNLEGQTIDLKDALKDGPVLVELFATWCSHCQETAPILKELRKEFGDKFQILAVNAGGDREGGMTLQEYLQTFEPEYPILEALATEESDTGIDYCLTSFPTIYLVNQRQVITWRALGTLEGETLESLRQQLQRL